MFVSISGDSCVHSDFVDGDLVSGAIYLVYNCSDEVVYMGGGVVRDGCLMWLLMRNILLRLYVQMGPFTIRVLLSGHMT